jgi:LmbE family N-acetylglucosaminyl deacetylase
MKKLSMASAGLPLKILCLGAHADDIEIGAGGTILGLIAAGVKLDVHWCVMSATPDRAQETRRSAAFLQGATAAVVEVCDFEDSYFPCQSREIKQFLLGLRTRVEPEVIFTHSRFDAHQDHQELNRLTTNVFRDHFVLEYEIPKWDGDLSERNTYVPLLPGMIERKIELRHAAVEGLVPCGCLPRHRPDARHGMSFALAFCGGVHGEKIGTWLDGFAKVNR